MRGRWASAALGAGIARRRAGAEMEQQSQAYEAQNQQAQQQIEAQQRQIEALQRQQQQPLKKQHDYHDRLHAINHLGRKPSLATLYYELPGQLHTLRTTGLLHLQADT